MTSQIKTALLLALLTGLMLLIGQAAGGRAGLVIALVLALAMNFVSYWYSDRIVLSMYQAAELSRSDAPWLHDMVEELSRNAGIPKPRICLIPQAAPNAFATGRDPEHAVVAVTEGIVQALSPEELRGVLAHEIGHIKNRDILIQSVAAVLGAAIMSIANMLQWGALFGLGRRDGEEDSGGGALSAIALAIIAPVAAMLIQMAISRSREFLADQTGAEISGRPLDLASALGRLDAAAQRIPLEGSPVAENLFIVNPFSGGVAGLFSTHPPIAERIHRLRELARRQGQGGRA